MDVQLQRELHEAIENWRRVWKRGDIEEILQLYSPDVRVMRSGIGLIHGREQLKPTLQQFGGMGLNDIRFVSDEIGGVGGNSVGEGSLAFQRYHEDLLREDGSEISTIWGMMLWKKKSGAWLIEAYANCAVPGTQANTANIRVSIQKAFDKLSETWASQNAQEVTDCFSEDCVFMPPGENIRGKPAIEKWLRSAYSKKWMKFNAIIESVIPMADIYITSQLVYVRYTSLNVKDSHDKVVKKGSGTAIMKRVDNGWIITEALWNLTD
jgi:uncharacterized protein (TIGR02246 family)